MMRYHVPLRSHDACAERVTAETRSMALIWGGAGALLVLCVMLLFVWMYQRTPPPLGTEEGVGELLMVRTL